MRKSPVVDALSALFLLSTLLVVTLFAASDDTLFFQSDPGSVLVVSAAFGLALALALAAIGLCLAPIARARRVMATLPALAVSSLLVAALTLFALDLLQAKFRIFGFLKGGYDEALIVGLSLACLAWTGRRLSRHPARAQIEARVHRLARILAPLVLIALVVLVARGRASTALAGAPRHAVVVVLDGWPANHLHTFNPAVPARPVDSAFADARVFRGMHTNATWTHGYFGALYLGSTAATYLGRLRVANAGQGATRAAARWDLWSALQRLGVTTQWITFHQNGIPESRAVSDYRGFRSIHLTHRYAPVLRALGLDYNLVMCGPAAARMAASPRRRAVYARLNPPTDVENAFDEVLLPEMRALRRRSDRTFLLFHAGWTAGRVTLPAAWRESSPRTRREQSAERIKRNDNRHDEGDEWYAQELRAKTALYTDALGERIERFLSRLRAEGWLDDTMVILTADHGHMFERGRFWYGFHPDEEVTRVPLVLLGAGDAGVDDAPRETIDITRTIVEYFGGEFVSPRAASILGPADKTFTVTATLPSSLHREWFLVLYSRERKYVFNLEPGGSGECHEVPAYANGGIASSNDPDVFATMRPYLQSALAELGVSPAAIHERYRGVMRR